MLEKMAAIIMVFLLSIIRSSPPHYYAKFTTSCVKICHKENTYLEILHLNHLCCFLLDLYLPINNNLDVYIESLHICVAALYSCQLADCVHFA